MKKRKVRVTNTGYLPNSPDRNNPMNIIPSNQITMKNVPFPIMGIDNLGNQQMMMPGGEYTFPGQYVTEIPMGKYQEGGLVKYQKKGQVSFDDYMMEGLRPRSVVQESTYRPVPIIEQEKKDDAKGVTTKQKVQAAANKKKIAEEEKKKQFEADLANQGEIKPATEGTERLKNQFIYAMDQPLDALGSLMYKGYVPQGNLNGNYETASPMSSVIGAFNPASILMDIGRVSRDLGEKETYTTLGGAGEGLLNVAGFLPFGNMIQKSKKILPANPSQKDLKDLYSNRLANIFSDDITEEQAKTLDRRLFERYGAYAPSKQEQQKLFDEATEFQNLWTYSKEGKKQVDDYLKPTFDALNAEQHAIVNKRQDLKKGLLEERSKIDAALSDPKNANDFGKLNQRYNEIEKELQEVKNMDRDRFLEINSLLEDLDSEMRSAVYDKDFKRKAQFLIDAGKSSKDPKFNHDLFYQMDLEPFDKSKTKLVYLDETDPSFMSLSDESKEYLRNNYERIGGFRNSDATVTLGSKNFPQIHSYIVKEKLPRSITNPFKSKTKDVILDVKDIRLHDPDTVGGVNAHEIRHDTQRIGNWVDTISKYDKDLEYYISHEDNPVAKEFKDALVEPGLPKSYETWLAAPKELDAELSKARFQATKKMMKAYGLSMEDAIKVLKEDRDDYTDYLIEIGDLNKHFKPETTQEEKRRLIKMLPAVIPAIGAGYLGSKLYNSQQQKEPTLKQGGMYLGKYEFKDGGLVKMAPGGANPGRYSGKLTIDDFNKIVGQALEPTETFIPFRNEEPSKNISEFMGKKTSVSRDLQNEKKIEDKVRKYESSSEFQLGQNVYRDPKTHINQYEKTADYKLRHKNISDYNSDDVKQIQKKLVDEGLIKSSQINLSDYKTKDDVKKLQRFLVSQGLADHLGKYGENKDGVDGQLGKMTRATVELYNKNNKGYDEGKLDDKTREAVKQFKAFSDAKKTTGINIVDPFNLVDENGDPKVDETYSALQDYENQLNRSGYFKGNFKIDTSPITEYNKKIAYNFKINPDPTTPFGMCAQYVNGTVCKEDVYGQDAREKLGFTGPAWHVSDNIQNKGGSLLFAGLPERSTLKLKNKDEINSFVKNELVKPETTVALQSLVGDGNIYGTSKVKPGDVVNIFYEGSNYAEEAYSQTAANNNRLFTTHVGIVKADDQGNLYVEHNIHGDVKKDPIGNFLTGKVKGNGRNKVSLISGITRPKYFNKVDANASLPVGGIEYYQTDEGQFNPEGVFATKDYLAQSVSGKQTYELLKTIEKNKKGLLKDIPITEGEFTKLLRVTRALPTLETYSKSQPLTQWEKDKKALQDTFYKEKSMGITKLKDESNLGENLRKKLITSDEELDNPVKAALPTFYSLSKNYLYLKDVANKYKIDINTDELAKLAGISWNQSVSRIATELVKSGSYDDYVRYRESKAPDKKNFKYREVIDVYDTQTMRYGGTTQQQGIYLGKYEFKDGGLVKAQDGKQLGPRISNLPQSSTPKINIPDVTKPLPEEFQQPHKYAMRTVTPDNRDNFAENTLEFFDYTGFLSWDDAKEAYNEWKMSGQQYPTVKQALDMFSAVPALGKFGKIKYLDPDAIKQSYKYIPWQEIINFFDTVEDIENDNMPNMSNLPIKNNGGLVRAQKGKEIPFGLPLKEQNIYLLPEYNQPRNPMTGEILPDPQRPNLGMGTGATEYKYTYGSDEGDIDVPSIVAGQYIGDQALDRYMLTGERFKTMADPGSYSKFYNETGRLGLMQEKKGGSVRKVKIKRAPRKNQ